MKKLTLSVLVFALLAVGLIGCSSAATPLPPTSTPLAPTSTSVAPTHVATAPPTPASGGVAGGITHVAVRIVQEQGSGAPCSAEATYFVYADITSNGPTTAKYEISATSTSGQVENGVFDTFDAPYVSDSLQFEAAETKNVSLRLKGPYNNGPDSITIRARVNGGDSYNAELSCASGEGSAGGDLPGGGITNTALKFVQEQGSGAICVAETTYFVMLNITANGPTTAKYEISATDASGQVEDGVFDGFDSSYVSDGVKFDAAGTQTISLRLIGPYSYPDTITIRARVNGGDLPTAQVSCK